VIKYGPATLAAQIHGVSLERVLAAFARLYPESRRVTL
jgi:hypothetical protein